MISPKGSATGFGRVSSGPKPMLGEGHELGPLIASHRFSAINMCSGDSTVIEYELSPGKRITHTFTATRSCSVVGADVHLLGIVPRIT